MVDLGKLEGSRIEEIVSISRLIYDRDGLEKGLSAEDVDEVVKMLVHVENSVNDFIESEVSEAVESALEERDNEEQNFDDALAKAKDSGYKKGYDEGYEEGYEDGSSFKERVEKKVD